MLLWQRILRVAMPTALLAAFLIWLVTAPSDQRRPARADGRGGMPGGLYDPFPTKADQETQRLLQKAVTGQLQAFNRGDPAAALAFSTTSYRNAYSARRFAEMVRRGYPAIAASRRSTCRPARRRREQAMMPVLIEGRDGTVQAFLYSFTREEGSWRISSVTHTSPPRSPTPRKLKEAPASVGST